MGHNEVTKITKLLKVYQRNLEKSMVSTVLIWYLEILLSKEA